MSELILYNKYLTIDLNIFNANRVKPVYETGII